MTAITAIDGRSIRQAISRIREEGVPRARRSTKFCLVIRDGHLPPKYVVALAARASLGRALRPDEFSGGEQTNALLSSLGFDVSACNCGGDLPRTSNAQAGARDAEVTIARIVCDGDAPATPSSCTRALLEAFTKRWPRGVHAQFATTGGGFVELGLEGEWKARRGWSSRACDLRELVELASAGLSRVMSKRVRTAAMGKADILTIGVDLRFPWDDEDPSHAELVAVYDIQAGRPIAWTGKSYPTPRQQANLVQVTDLRTHFVKAGGERVMVLGCHDLNMFSPRAHANQSAEGPRRARCDEMRALAKKFRPTVVLQHPHSTDTPNIWRMPWMSLLRELPSVGAWASGLVYPSGRRRASLERVLDLTRSESGVVDVVVDCGG